MYKNYFTIGWRNLLKQKMFSFIKIGGFALGIAACLLITLFIRDELSYDRQYTQGDRIYRVIGVFQYLGQTYRDVWFQAPFAQALKSDYPEIEKAGRYNSSELFGMGHAQIRRDDTMENTYEEGFTYIDQELLEILQVPMVFGNLKHCLDEPNTIVITRRKAEKYFPNENPVGKLMILNDNTEQPFKVGGVIENLPTTSHLQFDFFVTLHNREMWPGEQTFWGATNYPTYFLLKEGVDPRAFEKKITEGIIQKYLLPLWIKEGRTDAEKIAQNARLELQPIQDIHLYSAQIAEPLDEKGDIRFVWLFGAVAGFILLIAAINFINLSTAKSANRAKEVGLRKTVGSYRGHIIQQFLTESVLFSVLSFALGIAVAQLALPFFNTLAAKSLTFPWALPWFIPTLLGASLFVGIIAGIYPAFYLSSFKPIQVLKGNLSRGSKNSMTRSSLVVFQFASSIVLIISTFVIYKQMHYILDKEVGFDKEQVVMIHGTNTLGDRAGTFKDELLQLSAVKSVSISDYLPVDGTKRDNNAFWNEGRQKMDEAVGAQKWSVDHDYIKTMGMKIVAGRDFSRDMKSDTAAIIINQTMAKELGLNEPLGKPVQNAWQHFTVVGVIEDFHFASLREEIRPLGLILGGFRPSVIAVKTQSDDLAGTLSSIEAIWKKVAPNQPIRYTFLNENFARMYDDVQRMGRIFTSFSLLAIIVACLGLFALSAFMVEQRGKEISIRLVLGASLKSIFSLLTINFLKLVLIAIIIATPLAWYMMKKWLEDFSYKTEITWDIFMLAATLAACIALLTISYQAIRAALAKPVTNLKSE